jgi:phosphohistidine swiveling domain-containing protein
MTTDLQGLMSLDGIDVRKDQHTMETVLSFDKLLPERQASSGGKGGTLARLYQAGYPVPDGLVVLPTAFAGDELPPDTLSAEVWTQVQAHLARLRGNDPQAAFAVRSSALAEDSARASFAGEFETVLDARDDEAVRQAIGVVRRSRHAERVRAYARARGVETDLEMAVVVQRLVRADLSGVLFSADPVTGSRDHMSGNYVHGLGEALVSGQATPHEFTLSRPRGRYDGPAELKRFARRLYRLAKRLERDLGCPQDIEWAIAEGKVYILQSRPITTLLGFDPLTGEYNDSLTGDYVWSCVNVGEALSVVMTPFTWSVMRMAFGELEVLPGYASVGNIGGRLYQNVTVGISVLGALGQNIEDMVTEMGGVREEYLETMDQYLIPLPEATPLTILPGAIRMWRKQRAGLKNLESFLAGNPGWCQAMRQRIEAIRNRDELATLFVDELKPRSLESFWRNYVTALRYGEWVGKLRRELLELVGSADADALLSNVSRQGELLASLGPVVGLARLARGEMSRETYLAQWGHRGPLEAEVSVPRPFEDPDWLDRQLAAWAESPVDVEGLLARQRTEFDAAWERFCNRYPRRVKSMRRRLDRAAEAARQREAARSESTRLLWVSRTWVLRAGALTGLGEDAFFLSLDELLDLLAGREAPVVAIPARRQTYERYKALPPYPLLVRGRFDPFQWVVDPDRRDDVFDSHGLLPKLTLKAPAENMILGMPGSAGQVEGRVRRLDRSEDGHELQPGEILVAKQTNIGWTLLFPRAGAVVTDVGAPLSHAAIVARELGIPAVVNCGDATVRLHTGDRVRVDGAAGVVELLEPR